MINVIGVIDIDTGIGNDIQLAIIWNHCIVSMERDVTGKDSAVFGGFHEFETFCFAIFR